MIGTEKCMLSIDNQNIDHVYNATENEDLALFAPTAFVPAIYPLIKAIYPDIYMSHKNENCRQLMQPFIQRTSRLKDEE